MEPREYEQFVADYFQRKGYQTEVTPYSGDYGVDVIAVKGNERIAIQAKMYANTSRKVNRETVMQLHGSMAFHDCTKAVLATDGIVMPDAEIVAKKLGVEILYLEADIITTQVPKVEIKEKQVELSSEHQNVSIMSFDEMWKTYIMPLAGKTISNQGLENKIIKVDWGALTRETSNGKTGKITIEDFRYAYNQLIQQGSVERTLINQHVKRCSSGIVLVLSQVPFIGVLENPKILYIKSL